MLSPFERLQAIIDGADVAVWQFYVPTDSMIENSVFPRLLGLDTDTVDPTSIRSHWAVNMHPDDRPDVVSMRKRLMAGELDDYSVDYRVRRDVGGWNTLRSRVRIVERDEAGKPLWLAGVVTDVSGEKELQRLLKALFDRPFALLALLSPEGILLETNGAALEHAGVAAADVVGKYFWEGAFKGSAEMQQKLRNYIKLATKDALLRVETSVTGVGGEQRTLDFTLTPMYDDSNALCKIIAEARDISDFARVRDSLADAEERLRTATAGANIGLYDWKVGSDERWYNDQFFLMLGYNPAEMPLTQATMQNLCHPDDWPRVTARMQDYIEGRSQRYDQEFRARTRSGEWRWIHTQASAVGRSSDGRALRVAGVHIDITERKAIELQLAAAQRLESIGQLAAGIAHEINTPVQYVNDSSYFVREGVQELLGLVQKLQAQLPAAPPSEEVQYLQENLPAAIERMIEGVGRISEIVRSMKEFSHPDQKEMAPYDINAGIQSTLVVAKSEYKFHTDVETCLGEIPLVACHGGEINQVVLNLVINGAHAIADRVKGSGERGQIFVGTRLDGDEVVISVADTGGGIPEAVRQRIFEPFFTTKEVGRGTGQGLAIARNVARKHGGSLSFQTEVGKGTTFYLRLPIQAAKPAGQEEAAA